MQRIQFTPHAADIRLQIEADSRERLFQAGLEGMNNVLKPSFCNDNPDLIIETMIRLRSTDLTGLLIDFLSDVLTESLTQRAIFCRIEIEHFRPNQLAAWLFGAPVDGFDEDVKAVTYHEAEIRQNAGGNWETTVVFDI